MRTIGRVNTRDGEGRLTYREVRRKLKNYLMPVEPDSAFSRRLEELCESMGAKEVFLREPEPRLRGLVRGERRGMVIGGAIFSALPFVGFAAYAISRYLLRRRVVPIGA